MKKKIHILLVLLLSINVSCNDGFLDTTPYDGLSSSQIFNSDQYALMAINGAYNALAQNAFSADFYVFVSCLGPEGYGHSRGDWGQGHSQGFGTSRHAQVTNVYRNMYRPIIYSNDIIAGLEGNEMVTAAVRERLIGEAKFLRSLCYFYLYNLYGGVPILDKPTPVGETSLPRNTKEEVIQFVIKDFTDAAARLPETNQGRATKGAAIAMLGKVYLYNKNWAQAAAEFAKLLATPYAYSLVPNFGDNFDWKTKNNKESVFEIQYAMVPGAGSSFNSWFGNRTTGLGAGGDYCEMSQRAFQAYTYTDGTPMDFSTIPRRSNYATDRAYGVDLIAWYELKLKGMDIRLHQSAILPGGTYLGFNGLIHKMYWPISDYRSASPPSLWHTFGNDAIIPIRKFVTVGQENTVGNQDGPTNFPVVRFADVLLMYAEALNEANGPVADVYSTVDKVRSRAGLQGLTALKPGISKDAMRREIWLERYRELMFESVLFFDVRRWNVAHTNDPIFGLNNDENDFRLITKFYTKKFNAERDYLWPIPGAEMDINPKMTQNPGW
jgi:hypothetical protein